MLLVGAHAIRTIRTTTGGVGVDASTVLAVFKTADEAKHVPKIILGGFVGNNATEGIHHARAKLRVGGRRKRVRHGLPFANGDLGA